MKKILLGVLCVFIGILLSSCSAANAPRRDVAKMLDYMVQGKYAKAEQYIVDGDLGINGKNRQVRGFYNAMFSTLSGTVGDCVVEGDYAELYISITMVDMEALLADASLELLEYSMGTSSNDVKFYKLLTDKIEANEIAYTTNSVVVYLQKSGGKWKVDLARSVSFETAISGGVYGLLP